MSSLVKLGNETTGNVQQFRSLGVQEFNSLFSTLKLYKYSNRNVYNEKTKMSTYKQEKVLLHLNPFGLKQTEKLKKQTDEQTDKKTDKKTDEKTCEQTDEQTHEQTREDS